jgi:hypothetical protein
MLCVTPLVKCPWDVGRGPSRWRRAHASPPPPCPAKSHPCRDHTVREQSLALVAACIHVVQGTVAPARAQPDGSVPSATTPVRRPTAVVRGRRAVSLGPPTPAPGTRGGGSRDSPSDPAPRARTRSRPVAATGSRRAPGTSSSLSPPPEPPSTSTSISTLTSEPPRPMHTDSLNVNVRSSFTVVELPLGRAHFLDQDMPAAIRHIAPIAAQHLRRGLLLFHSELVSRLEASGDGSLPLDFPVLDCLRTAVSSHLRREFTHHDVKRGGLVARGLAAWAAAGGAPPPPPLHAGIGADCKMAACCVSCEAAVDVTSYRMHVARCPKLVAAPPVGPAGGPVAGASGAAGPSPAAGARGVPTPPTGTSAERLYGTLSGAAYSLFRTAFSGLRGTYLITVVLQYVQISFDLPAAQATAILLTPTASLTTALAPALLAVLDRTDPLGWSLERVRDTLHVACRPTIVKGRAKACSTTMFTNSELSVAVVAALMLRYHIQAAHRHATSRAGGSTPGFPCPILTPSAAWSQGVVDLTRAGATELGVVAGAVGLWDQVVGQRLAGASPGSSSDAAWVGCIAESRIARGQWVAPSSDVVDKDTEADVIAAEGQADVPWTSQFLNTRGDPTLTRLVRRLGPPCGVGVNAGSVFVRFHTTVLVQQEFAATEDTHGATNAATCVSEVECEVDDVPVDDVEGMGEGPGPDTLDDSEPVNLCVDVQYRRWRTAPAPKAVKSYYDPALCRDSDAFVRGQHGLYAICAVPIQWQRGGVSLHGYDPGLLVIAAGVSTAGDATFFTREVGGGGVVEVGWGGGERRRGGRRSKQQPPCVPICFALLPSHSV